MHLYKRATYRAPDISYRVGGLRFYPHIPPEQISPFPAQQILGYRLKLSIEEFPYIGNAMFFSKLFHSCFKIRLSMIFIIEFKQITVDDFTYFASQSLGFIQPFHKLLDISSAKSVDDFMPRYFHELFILRITIFLPHPSRK